MKRLILLFMVSLLLSAFPVALNGQTTDPARVGFRNGRLTALAITWGSDLDQTLPDADGSANQVITTDGSGALSWDDTGVDRIDSTLTANLEDSLVFSLDIAGSSETVARDMSGNDNDGVLVDFAHDATEGYERDGSRYAIKYTNARVIAPISPSIDSTGDFAIAMEFSQVDTSGNRFLMRSTPDDGGDDSGKFGFSLYTTTGLLRLVTRPPDFSKYNTVDAALTLIDTINYHQVIAGRSGDNLIIYVNGDSIASSALSGDNLAQTDSIVIGSQLFDTGSSQFIGSIAGIRLYNRALTANEVSALYHQFRQEIQPGHPVAVDDDRDLDFHADLTVDDTLTVGLSGTKITDLRFHQADSVFSITTATGETIFFTPDSIQ